MNHGPLIFLGAFGGFVISWFCLVLNPYWQIGGQQPDVSGNLSAIEVRTNWLVSQHGQRIAKPSGPGSTYPVRPGMAQQGLNVYRASGCVYCHSQQVRDFPGDLLRWGPRRTVAQDYLYDNPVQLGSQRIGPDLANVGLRKPSEAWHLLHLYDPKQMVKGSTMPPYRYLFERRKIKSKPAPDALKLEGVSGEYEVVPTDDARALVAYLKSLQAGTLLFETPMAIPTPPPGATNQTGTNLPAALPATNAAAGANPATKP